MTHYSGILLEKLLALDVLKNARVLAGATGMNRRVVKVNVMEVPDILDWVGRGELLLTAAFPIKDDIQMLHALIPRLKGKGVVGLGIKLGRYVPEMPRNIIDLADELGFPIIGIPLSVSHTDVISAILTEVINDQMNMFIKMEEFNLEVMNIMIKGGGMKEIAGKLYDNIGHPLAIYERINGSSELICPVETDREAFGAIIRNYTGIRPIPPVNAEDDEGKFHDPVGGKLFERIIIPIVIEKIQYGCIFIWLDSGKRLTPFDTMLIKSYVHIIALEFVKKLALYNMESNYKADFFDDLLSDNRNRQNRALEKANTFNFKKDLKHTAIIILLKELYRIDKFTYKKANFAKECMTAIISIMNRMVKLHGENVVYVEKSDRILIIYSEDTGKNNVEIKEKAKAFCKKILDGLEPGSMADQLSIGLGRCCESTEQLWKSYDQAKLIVENITGVNKSKILHYDDLGLYRFLSFDGMRNELDEFYSATIKPLVEFDRINHSELVITLKQYFNHGGNMKKMSETMHMHYNTIIYRLQRIRDILKTDIDDPEIRLNLEISIKIMDLLPISTEE